VKGEIILHLGRSLIVFGVDVQNIPIHLVESHAGKQPIECGAADDERHAGCNCLILYRRQARHRSPGHHIAGGSLAEIFVGRSATK
jgi:hypothetical protein